MANGLQTESCDATDPSLLTWLQPPGGGLNLSLLRDGDAFEELPPVAPMTRRLAGGIGCSGQLLLRVNLLVQSDQVPHRGGKGPPSNTEVEALWQRTLDRHQFLNPSGLPAAPLCQKDPGGRWRPFRPLWHCRHVDRFGHALCPDCGRGLELCRDDRLLGSADLAKYSHSSIRHLYCATCAAKGPLRFYALGSAPSPCVGDPGMLAAGFGRLLARSELRAELPCVDCPEAGECFGARQSVLERMQPVFFYPFYLVIQPAPAFDADAFRALEGSDRPSETEAGIAAFDTGNPTETQETLNGDGRRQAEASPIAPPACRTPDDAAIASIVADVLREWPADDAIPVDGAAGSIADETMARTIVLSSQPPPAESLLKKPEIDADIERTVALGGQGVSRAPDRDLDATVLLGGQSALAPPPPADLTETVVLNAPPYTSPDVATGIDNGPIRPGGEELEKTVLLTPASPGGAGEERSAPPETEADLEATIVYKPVSPKHPSRKS